MVQRRIQPMVEGGILSAIAIIFAFISAYLPVLGPFVNLIWPVPMILLGVRHGYKWSLLATVAAGLLIALLMHPLHALSVVVGFGLIGIVLGHAFRSDFAPGKTMIWGTAASLLSKAAIIGLGIVVTGINPLDMGNTMTKTVEQAIDLYRGMGMSEEQLAQVKESMQTVMKLVPLVLPTGFFMAAIVDTYLNFLVAKAVLRKLGHTVQEFPPFKHWTMPLAVVYAFAFALVGIYWGQSREIQLLYQAGMNLQVLASCMLFLQGMALIYFLADKYNLSRLTRGIILVLVFTNGWFAQIVIFAGVFDLVADYRRLRTPRSME